MLQEKTNSKVSGNEITMSRVFNAPRELVFDAWTDPEHIAKWWGPDGFTNTIQEMNVTPGGVWKFMMHGPDGTNFPNKIVYSEVVRPEKLVYHHSGEDENGDDSFDVTVTFEELDSKTLLTMHSVHKSAELIEMLVKEYGVLEGGKQNLARFAQHLEDVAESENLVIERDFNAPRELVYKAWTTPEHLAKWWGPKGCELKVLKLELTPGGVFHYSMEMPGAPTFYGRFTFRELRQPEYLSFVSGFADEKGNLTQDPWSLGFPLEVWNEVELTEQNGKTRLRIFGRPLNATAEQRALHKNMRGNMQEGFAGTFDKLDELLTSL